MEMPDRAVVDERTAYIAGYEAGFGDRYYEHSEPEASYSEWVSAARPEIPRDPPPRARVALSEDGQWLVVHHLGTGFWQVLDICHWGYLEYASVEDTGQDAREVLEKFLEGRDGTTPDSDYPLRDLPTDRAEADDVHPGAGAGTGQ